MNPSLAHHWNHREDQSEGTCYANATGAEIESAYYRKYGQNIDVSDDAIVAIDRAGNFRSLVPSQFASYFEGLTNFVVGGNEALSISRVRKYGKVPLEDPELRANLREVFHKAQSEFNEVRKALDQTQYQLIQNALYAEDKLAYDLETIKHYNTVSSEVEEAKKQVGFLKIDITGYQRQMKELKITTAYDKIKKIFLSTNQTLKKLVSAKERPSVGYDFFNQTKNESLTATCLNSKQLRDALCLGFTPNLSGPYNKTFLKSPLSYDYETKSWGSLWDKSPKLTEDTEHTWVAFDYKMINGKEHLLMRNSHDYAHVVALPSDLCWEEKGFNISMLVNTTNVDGKKSEKEVWDLIQNKELSDSQKLQLVKESLPASPLNLPNDRPSFEAWVYKFEQPIKGIRNIQNTQPLMRNPHNK